MPFGFGWQLPFSEFFFSVPSYLQLLYIYVQSTEAVGNARILFRIFRSRHIYGNNFFNDRGRVNDNRSYFFARC